MKTLLAALAALALFVSAEAAATTYNISGTGNDLNDGSTQALAWRTVKKANKTVRPGDIVLVWPGRYETFPDADSAGSNPTGMIRWVGAGTADPTADTTSAYYCYVPGGTTGKSYQSWNGLFFGGDGVRMQSPATFDSLKNCILLGNLQLRGARYCIVDNILNFGSRLYVGRPESGIYTSQLSQGNKVFSSKFRRLGRGVLGGEHVIYMTHIDSCLFDHNEFYTVMDVNAVDVHPRIMYTVSNTVFQYNRFDVTNNSATSGAFTLAFRDSSCFNLINGDTINVNGPGRAQLGFSTSGAYPNTCRGNTIDSCRFVVTNGVGIWFQNWMDSCTVTNNIIVSRDEALSINGLKGPNTIDHNTIVSGTSGQWSPGIVAVADTAINDTTKFTNNIVYSTIIESAVPKWSVAGGSSMAGVVVGSRIPLDFLKSRWNLYGVWQYRYAKMDRANAWWRAGKGLYNANIGGITTAQATALTQDYTTTNRASGDSLSYFGSPQFVDSTLSFKFNATLLGTSLAIAKGKSASAIGAVAYASLPVASVSRSGVVFAGTAVGAADSVAITVHNTGAGGLTGTLVVDDSDLSLSSAVLGVEANAKNTYWLIFTPTSMTQRSATLTITTNDPSHPTFSIPVSINYGGGDPTDGFKIPTH